MKNSLNYLLLLLFLSFLACEEKEENPQISTDSVTALSAKRFHVKALVLKKGNIPITDYGFVYYLGSESTSSQWGENKLSLGQKLSSDTFSTDINISISQGYYSDNLKLFVKAYLKNEKGTMYAKPMSANIVLSQVTNVIPNYGKAGDTIMILGTSFDPIPSNNSVLFNNISAKVVEATSLRLKVIVPPNITQNSYESYVTLKVINGNRTSDYTTNFSLNPSAISFTPNHGTWGTSIVITGSNLYNVSVYFNDLQYSNYNSQNNSVTVTVPSNMSYKNFKLYIGKNGQKTEVPGGVFSMDKLQVNSVSPVKCLPGNSIKIYGKNFNPYSSEYNIVHIGNLKLSSSYTSNYVTFYVPSDLAKGIYTAYLSNRLDTVQLPQQIEIVRPEITSISTSSGYQGSKFTLKGKNLYNGSSSTYLYFDDYSFSGTVEDSSTIKGTVPFQVPGIYTVYAMVAGLKIKCPEAYTILTPKLTSVTPSSGVSDSIVTISGEGFGNSVNNVYVYFGSRSMNAISINANEIMVRVPSGLTSGNYTLKVSINGYAIPGSLTFNVP